MSPSIERPRERGDPLRFFCVHSFWRGTHPSPSPSSRSFSAPPLSVEVSSSSISRSSMACSSWFSLDHDKEEGISNSWRFALRGTIQMGNCVDSPARVDAHATSGEFKPAISSYVWWEPRPLWCEGKMLLFSLWSWDLHWAFEISIDSWTGLWTEAPTNIYSVSLFPRSVRGVPFKL